MRRFLIKTFVFVAVASLVPAAILLWPVSKRYQYAFVRNDCAARSNYIYHRLYEDTTRVDIAFIGTSHTMCGVSDSIVNSVLKQEGIHARVANLAICRVGSNMDYVVIKDLLKMKKQPKLIVLEVKQEEPDLSHPDFGYRAEIEDVFFPQSAVDVQYFKDLAAAFNVRLNYVRDGITGRECDGEYEAPSLGIYRQKGIADTTVLYQGALRRWERYYSQPRPAWIDSIMLRYPRAYMMEIMRMARESHTKVVMLYIPNFGYPWHKPRELAYYRGLADVYLMPDSFYDNKGNWIEDEHLNADGAAILSDSVAHYIARQLR